MSDIFGKTITEYALERRIRELERMIWELQRRLPVSDLQNLFKESPDVFTEMRVDSIKPFLPLAVRCSATSDGNMSGYIVKAQAYNMSKGTFDVGFYIDERIIRGMNDYCKADYLRELISDVTQRIAEEISK